MRETLSVAIVSFTRLSKWARVVLAMAALLAVGGLTYVMTTSSIG